MFYEKYEDAKYIVFIDTETVTDQLTQIPKLWEIGIVILENDQIVDEQDYMISPDAQFEKLDLVYEKVSVSLEKIKNSPKFIDIYPKIKKYLNSDYIIGGHNVDYDIRVVNRELNVVSGDLIGSKKIDTLRMARTLYPKWSHHKLDNLCEEFNLNINKRHRALDDIYATAQAYLIMKNKIINDKNIEKSFSGGLF